MNDTQEEFATNVRDIFKLLESGDSVEWLQRLEQRLGDDITDADSYKLLLHQIREVQILYSSHTKQDQEVLCNAIKVAMRIGYEAGPGDLKLDKRFVWANHVTNVVHVWNGILANFKQEVESIWNLLNEQERSVFKTTSEFLSVDESRGKRKRGHSHMCANVVENAEDVVKMMKYIIKVNLQSVISEAVENSDEKVDRLMKLLHSLNKCTEHVGDVGMHAVKMNYIPQIQMGAFENVASFLHLADLKKDDFDLLVFRTILEHAEWRQQKMEADASEWIQLSCEIWFHECQDKQPCIVREVREHFFGNKEQEKHTVAMQVQCTDATLIRQPSCAMTKMCLKLSVQVHSTLRNVVVFVGLGGVLVHKTKTIHISP